MVMLFVDPNVIVSKLEDGLFRSIFSCNFSGMVHVSLPGGVGFVIGLVLFGLSIFLDITGKFCLTFGMRSTI